MINNHEIKQINGLEVWIWTATETDPSYATIEVPSDRDPEKKYTVIIQSDDITCDCSDFTFRGYVWGPDGKADRNKHICKHGKMVKSKLIEAKSNK